MKKRSAGFTLIEMMVVVVIVSILSGALYANFSDAKAQSRDAKRQADLRLVQSALELYKNENGRYPAGCNGPTVSVNNPVWSGQMGSDYACLSGNQYIVGLAPKYIPTLPNDPKLNGTNSGYVYTVNTDGTVYKLMALNTVELDTSTNTHVFARCDAECSRTPASATSGCTSPTYAYNNCGSPTPACSSVDADTYAVSGGYANENTEQAVEYYTEQIRCQ